MTAPATTRHAEATRTAILDAAVALFLERHSNAFSVQEVADRAGLTHRTVYRYFPTREDLWVATLQHLAPGLAEERFPEVVTVDEWIAAIDEHCAVVEKDLEATRHLLAAVLASPDLGLFGRDVHHRVDRHRKVFRKRFPHLPERDARRTFAAFRQQTSSVTYVFHRLRFGLTPADSAQAMRTAAQAIVDQAARHDAVARRSRAR